MCACVCVGTEKIARPSLIPGVHAWLIPAASGDAESRKHKNETLTSAILSAGSSGPISEGPATLIILI